MTNDDQSDTSLEGSDNVNNTNAEQLSALVNRIEASLEEAEKNKSVSSNLLNELRQAKDTLDSTLSELESIKTQSTASLDKIESIENEASTTLEAIRGTNETTAKELGKTEELRSQVEQHSQATAPLTSAAEEALNALEKAKKGTEKIELLETDAKTTFQNISSLCENAENKNAEILEAKELAENQLEKAKNTLKEIKSHAEITSGLSDKASQTESTIETLEEELRKAKNEYEERLQVINTDYDSLFEKIEGLLPGATSAGLASSFKERTDIYYKPRRNSDILFLICIVLLILVAIYNPIEMEFDTPTLETLGSYFLSRLPFILPLVWLAVVARKRATYFLQLQEEYAHKETISKSFEGYKKQFSEIPSQDERDSALTKLGSCVVETLGRNPSKVFENKKDHATISEARKLIEKLARMLSKLDIKGQFP